MILCITRHFYYIILLLSYTSWLMNCVYVLPILCLLHSNRKDLYEWRYEMSSKILFLYKFIGYVMPTTVIYKLVTILTSGDLVFVKNGCVFQTGETEKKIIN